jgi:hypothetical protein
LEDLTAGRAEWQDEEARMSSEPNREPIEEPPNSTVDDWFGQQVARDQEVADRVAQEADSFEEAEQLFEREADGEDRYRAGHPRPGSSEQQ